jgi:hypothetical protein
MLLQDPQIQLEQRVRKRIGVHLPAGRRRELEARAIRAARRT